MKVMDTDKRIRNLTVALAKAKYHGDRRSISYLKIALAIAKAVHDAHPEPFQRNTPEKEPLPGTRGGEYEGISIHSSRMPGRMAHHQVAFGAPGQTLTLRHDTINRECYMPGVLLAVRKVRELEGLTVGLDKLLEI